MLDIRETESYFNMEDGRVVNVVIELAGKEIYRYEFDKAEGEVGDEGV